MKDINEMTASNRPPDAIFYWKDSLPTGAEGWVVLDRIINQIAGGGIFMHRDATLQEAADIARNMSRKFTVTVPQIGGAKAGIRFNHKDPRASGVLRRFIIDHCCLLQNTWVTAGDLNTDDRLIEEIIQQELGLQSYQSALAKRLARVANGCDRGQLLADILDGVKVAYFPVIAACVGHGVARTIEFVEKRQPGNAEKKPAVAIQGFGAVGSSLAYFLHEHNIARVVSIADKYGYLHDSDGLDIRQLLEIRERSIKQLRNENAFPEQIQEANKNLFCNLDEHEKRRFNAVARRPAINDQEFLREFLNAETVEVFSPCALRYQITPEIAEHLIRTFQQSRDRLYLVGGANNMFDLKAANGNISEQTGDELAARLQQAGIVVVPDWVSNSGTAQLFHTVLSQDFELKDPQVGEQVLHATFQPITAFLEQALTLVDNDMSRLFDACGELARTRLESPKQLETSLTAI